MRQPLVVVVHRNREDTLGIGLADHVIVEDAEDFLRRGNAFLALHHRGFVLLADDVHAQLDAFITDEDGRARDQLAHLVLALSAERAVESVLGVATVSTATVANLAHAYSFQQIANSGSFRLPAIPTSNLRRGQKAQKHRHKGFNSHSYTYTRYVQRFDIFLTVSLTRACPARDYQLSIVGKACPLRILSKLSLRNMNATGSCRHHSLSSVAIASRDSITRSIKPNSLAMSDVMKLSRSSAFSISS
jgi:hypothetical protein